MKLMMSIPCTYSGENLNIKALRLNGVGYPAEEAFMNAIKSSPEMYAELCTAKIIEDKGRYSIIVTHSKKLYDKILELEPLPSDKPKVKRTGALKEADSEEVIKYGY